MKSYHFTLSTVLVFSVILLQTSHTFGDSIKALMIAGGCCHDYPKQNVILPEGVSKRAKVDWTVVLQGGTSRDVKIPIYDNPDWIKGYDVVVHNECFGGVADVQWLESIVKAHTESGVAAVFVHCSLHSYRAANTDEWRKLIGVTSRSHEGHRSVEVVNLKPEHPVMKGFPAKWKTPNGELYKIEHMWPNTIPLAQAYGKDTQKDHVCIWLNEYGKSRVFGLSLGHHNETMESEVYLDLFTRGLLWSVNKLNADGSPAKGLEVTTQKTE